MSRIGPIDINSIVLVNPPMRPEQVYGDFEAWGSVSPPTGLCYIAALLREKNYQVQIVDAEALRIGLKETVSKVLELNPDIIGIACKTLWINEAQKLAQVIKAQMPTVPIVAGGNHVTALPRRSLQEYSDFDVIVVGEGERTFLELVQALQSGLSLESVSGLAFRKEGEVVETSLRERVKNLDELPSPAFDLLPSLQNHYKPSLNSIKFSPAFTLVTSRGCTGKCTFCDRKVFGNKITFHSPKRTMEMIDDLYYNHGIRYLVFDDDNLLIKKSRAFELFDMIKKAPYKMPFTCQSRVDTINEELLRELKSAGCFKIMFGIESGSPKILSRMRKKISPEQIRTAVKLTRKFGILPSGYFILGHPGETVETMEETVALIRETDFFDVAVMLFSPLPGSEVYEGIEKWGNYMEDWDRTNSLDQSVFIPEGLTEELLMAYQRRCYRACLFRPKQLFSLHKRFSSLSHLRALSQTLGQFISTGS